MNKLLRSFRRKLMWEAVLKSLLFACVCGAASAFLISLIYHILIDKTPLLLTCLISGGVFVISFTVCLILHFPTKKRVARRVDGLGLQDRVSTMLAFAGDDREIVRLQREDAERHIASVRPGQLPLHIRTREIVTCAVCICLAVGMPVLPYNIFAADAAAGEEDARKQAVRDIIDALREQVRESRLNDELKEALDDVIDGLEEKLNNTDSELEQAAQIEKAKREMQEILEEALTRKKIGEALQQYDLTRTLGEAISRGSTEKVSTALDELQQTVTEGPELIAGLSEQLAAALADSGVASDDALYTALAEFSQNLLTVNPESQTLSEELTPVFDTAEAAINAALEEQAMIEEEMESIGDAMSDAKDELLGNEKQETETQAGEMPDGEMSDGEMSDGEMPDGEMPDGEMPDGERPDGEMPDGQGGEGAEGEGGQTMTEGIYDPISGNTAYGEVFAAYYAEYLAALGEGEIPDDMAAILEKYYDSLNQ